MTDWFLSTASLISERTLSIGYVFNAFQLQLQEALEAQGPRYRTSRRNLQMHSRMRKTLAFQVFRKGCRGYLQSVEYSEYPGAYHKAYLG